MQQYFPKVFAIISHFHVLSHFEGKSDIVKNSKLVFADQLDVRTLWRHDIFFAVKASDTKAPCVNALVPIDLFYE